MESGQLQHRPELWNPLEFLPGFSCQRRNISRDCEEGGFPAGSRRVVFFRTDDDGNQEDLLEDYGDPEEDWRIRPDVRIGTVVVASAAA